MADTQRTQVELLTLFADGQGTGSITPQDIRDFIVSIFNSTDDTIDLDERGSAPALISGKSRLYASSNGSLHIVTDDGMDRAVSGPDSPPVFKSYNLDTGTSGVYYSGGFYDFSTTDSNLTNVSPTQTHGGVTEPHAAHAFVVVSGPGVDNKSVGAVQLKVTGTSITDAGVRTASDSEVIIADIENGSVITNAYFETSKKWIGTITYTLENDGTGDATAFSLDFNYGLAKYEDFGNRNFTITDVEVVGVAGANDSSFNIEYLHHTSTGWVYAAIGFIAGNTPILDFAAEYGAEKNLVNGDPFAYKRSGLSTSVTGDNGEGTITRITTGANNSIESMDLHLGVRF